MRQARGNILFLILLAVVLFAALSYAVTSSMRGDGKNASAEKAQLDQAVLDNFQAEMDAALLRLKTTSGCSDAQISYETPSGANVNSNAPADKHCHVFSPLGAGVPWRDLGLGTGCVLTSLAIGQNCNGVVYAGSLSGVRRYITVSNNANAQWSTGTVIISGSSNMNDGSANTDNLLSLNNGSAYPAAASCRALGAKWYLPTQNEYTQVLYVNKTLLPNISSNIHWSSYGTGGTNQAFYCSLTTGSCSNGAPSGSQTFRCMRLD